MNGPSRSLRFISLCRRGSRFTLHSAHPASVVRGRIEGSSGRPARLWFDWVVALPVRLVALRKTQDDFYEPVGWSKCGGCGFKEKCWEAAEQCHDVALVPDIDQNLAIALHGIGVTSISQLLQSFDINSLSDFKRPVGKRIQKVGKKAERILRFAMSLESQQELVLAVPAIPTSPNYVMFDLEGRSEE